MTVVHNTPWRSMRAAISRAKGRADVKLRNPGLRFKRTIKDQEAYDAAIAERERLGLPKPQRLSKKQVTLRLLSNQHQQTARRRQQAAIIDEREEAAMRMISIVHRAIDSLLIGLRLMLTASGDPKVALPMSQTEALHAVNILCDLVDRARPDFALERQPGVKPTLTRCENCGLMLNTSETGVCYECESIVERQPAMADARSQREREQPDWAAKEKEIEELRKLITEMEDYARHGGHPRQDAAALAATGRREDHGDTSAIAHRDRADHSGNPEGGDGGCPPQPDPDRPGIGGRDDRQAPPAPAAGRQRQLTIRTDAASFEWLRTEKLEAERRSDRELERLRDECRWTDEQITQAREAHQQLRFALLENGVEEPL